MIRGLKIWLSWCCFAGAFYSSTLQAENWPRFRGPDGTGISSETGFPTTWTSEDYAWILDLPGKSHSSPVIWDQNLYLTIGMEEGKLRRLLCLDATTGQERWQRDLPLNTVHLHKKNSFASGSPATDGEHVVAAFGDEKQFIVVCWNSAGKELWRQDLGEFISQHGPSCSPIIHGRYVIVPKDMMGPSAVFALDVETGEILWKTDREYRRTSYATPVVRTRADGREEVICASGMTGISGLDLKTGEIIWATGTMPQRTVNSPVIAGSLVINSCGSGGRGQEMVVAPLDQTGTVTPQYKMSRKIPYVPTPVYKDGLLFMLLDGGMLSCIKPESGEELWTERLGGNFSGSPIWVEGRLYAIDEEGTVVVMAASEKFEELGRVSLGETSYATPAAANGRLYFKTENKLFCLPAK